VQTILTELGAKARAILKEGGVGDDEIATEISADMRYAGQGFEIAVPLDAQALAARDNAALKRAFDARYSERFARNLGGLPVEVVSWRLRLVAPPAVSRIRFAEGARAADDALIECRPVFFPELDGFADTPVYARMRLVPGQRIAGPALIEEAESTAVVGPSAEVTVDRFDNLIMRIEQGKTAEPAEMDLLAINRA
jgi:N-methylhydantoinase A/oxoprolinase/acetone carboxylase beta subunit